MDTEGYRDFRIAGRSPGRGRTVAAVIALVVVAAGAYGLFAWGVRDRRAIAAAAQLAREGKLDEAEARFRSLAGHRLYASSAGDGLGIVALLRGDHSQAAEQFAAAGKGPVRMGSLPWAELALASALQGDYERAQALARRGLERGDNSPVIHMSLGMALNGLDQLAEARSELTSGGLRSVFEEVRRGRKMLLGGVFRDASVLAAYTGHVIDLTQKERSQTRAYLYQKNGKPLFRLSIKTQQPVDIPAGLAVAVASVERGLTPRDRQGRVTTTIDPEIQKVAHRALRGQRGSAVILDLEGRVVASAARDDRKRKTDGQVAPDPGETWFALGSVAKVPTLTIAASTPGALEDLFPFSCDKPLKIGDKPFYDWIRHGPVPNVDEALAMSCNIVFAQIGLKLGRERLLDGFRAFGFGDASGAPGGNARIAGDLSNDTAVARLAVGLEHTETTTFGAAAIALAIATGGEYREPHLIDEIVAIGGARIFAAAPERHVVATARAIAVVRSAMTAVVMSERGTARRARGEVWTVAAKTGTTGSYKEGLDAVIVGFTPVERPRYVFAAYMPRSGRSEWIAADVARQIVDGLQALEDDRARSRESPW